MRLEIQDKRNELDYRFGMWLIRQIQMKFRASLDPRKLVAWDKFFEESTDYNNIYGAKIVTRDIMLSGIKCLICLDTPDKIIIQLNPNQFVPGLDRVKVDSIFRLITFGNQSIKGYPIFAETLQHFADNIGEYVDMYVEGF
jgi:hypothetical protein